MSSSATNPPPPAPPPPLGSTVASLIQGVGMSHQHAMQRQMQQHHMAQAVAQAQAQAQAASMGHHGYPMPLHPNHHQQTINSILSGQNAANAMQLPYANNFNGNLTVVTGKQTISFGSILGLGP